MNQKTNQPQRLPALDGLRAIAVCTIVFIWHFQHFGPQNGSPLQNLLQPLYTYGWLMVELFFMISGFVMVYCYEEKIINKTISFQTYFTKRLKHLYPLFFITLLATTILQLIYHAVSSPSGGGGGKYLHLSEL